MTSAERLALARHNLRVMETQRFTVPAPSRKVIDWSIRQCRAWIEAAEAEDGVA